MLHLLSSAPYGRAVLGFPGCHWKPTLSEDGRLNPFLRPPVVVPSFFSAGLAHRPFKLIKVQWRCQNRTSLAAERAVEKDVGASSYSDGKPF